MFTIPIGLHVMKEKFSKRNVALLCEDEISRQINSNINNDNHNANFYSVSGSDLSLKYR